MKKLFVVFISLLLVVYACKDIEETDLSKQSVNLLSPSNNAKIYNYNVQLWWDDIEETEKFNLQIAYPSFDSIQYLVLDTNISTNIFYINLNPGKYEWRVKAFNNSSQTIYYSRKFELIANDDLSNEVLIFKTPSPSDNLITNLTTFKFKWDTLGKADSYEFAVCQGAFNYSNVYYTSIVTKDSINYTFNEGAYSWGVRALNSNSSSTFSARTLTIDLTAPLTPTNLIPQSDSVCRNAPLSFSWTRGANTGSTLKDSLFIYGNQTKTIVKKKLALDNPLYSDSLGIGEYWWQVKSFDIAGNQGTLTILRKFTIE